MPCLQTLNSQGQQILRLLWGARLANTFMNSH
jgi:hypothetical protein